MKDVKNYAYNIITLDITAGLTEYELNLYGERLFYKTGSANIQIRFNDRFADLATFKPFDVWAIPFDKIFITAPATAETITIIVANDIDIQVDANLVQISNNLVEYATTPVMYNKTCTLANTEYSQALPANCKKFTVKSSDLTATLKIGFAAGSRLITLNPGQAYNEDLIKWASGTLYMSSDTAGTVVDVIAWS